MKCLVLAGGKGERLWPLSRNNFPKQFIKVQKNHSLFQETVARNIAYCDEFIIVTNYAYRSVISNQMEAFQGVSYRCVFEEEARKTTAAISLACLGLQPSEYVFVVAADHVIDTGECSGLSYKDAILRAKELARQGNIVLFGTETREINSRFGYFTDRAEQFIEKPERKQIKFLLEQGRVNQNLGMLLFQNGVLLRELESLRPEIYKQCVAAYSERKPIADGVLYTADVLAGIEAEAIERCILEPSDKKTGITIGFNWSDIGSLEDLGLTMLGNDGANVIHESAGSTIINQSPRQAVVLNDLDNVLVVNTPDAVYIGRKGKSHLLKEILHDNRELLPYAEQGTMFYRPWGYYEQLSEGAGFRVRKVTLLPGKTIYEHRHEKRSENWIITSGRLQISLGEKNGIYTNPDSIVIPVGVSHQVSNVGDKPAIFIETALGDDLSGDIFSEGVADITETGLGLRHEPMVKLSPAYKDYLWGGTKLREIYKKDCDLDTVAESWELSAHPAGNCIVASGNHKGLAFSKYISKVGREILGWKCSSLQAFPLLVKFIDAKQNLSVQVHPDDDYALENENEYGKNEMWYVIDAEAGAGLYVGFERDVSREEVERRVRDNSILEVMNFFPTKPGDVFFIPAGTVHAIGAGNLICEIQQSSDATYRLYDYDRRDKFGKARTLHLEKALDVLDYGKYIPASIELKDENGQKHIQCKYFQTSIVEVDGESTTALQDDSFYSASNISGCCTLELEEVGLELGPGESAFIPACKGKMTIKGKATLMITRI